jgi:flagellar export protein FliJ
MARFRFPLDPVLRMRRHAERERQRAVAAIEGERAALEAALRRLQEGAAGGRDELRDGLVGDVDVALLRQHAASAMRSARQARRIVLQMAGVHRRLEEARRALVEAMRRRRAIELLRERRLETWRTEARRRDAAALDDLAGARAGRTGAQA